MLESEISTSAALGNRNQKTEIPAGFKQTEVGMIPEDWDFETIESKIDLLTGFPFPSSQYQESGLRLLRCANIKRGNTDWSTENTIFWTESPKGLDKYKMLEGDLVIAMDGSLVGRSYAQLSAEDLPTLLLQRVARIRSKNISVDYLKHWVSSKWFVRYSDSVKTVTAIPHISPKNIRDFKVPLPPTLREQQAIAEALSDMDAMIRSLERLIEKKKAIKQGAMQELLKPKEGWVETTIGQIGKTYGGLSGKSKSDFGSGNAQYIPFMNVMSNEIIDTSFLEAVKIGSAESQNHARKGDLFFNGSSETPDELGLCSVLLETRPDLYLNSFCFGFRLNDKDVEGMFLSYLFRSGYGRQLFYSLAQGATRYNLSKSNFMKMKIKLPSGTEQKRVARVLLDMNEAIDVHEDELTKTRQLKQGMMQDLLTGKKRLNCD